MMNIRFCLLVILLLASGLARPATAQDRAAEVRALLEQRDRDIKKLIGDRDTFTDDQREALEDVINDGLDFEAMGRAALGPYWADLTPERRREFVDVFADIIRAHSLADLSAYRAEVVYNDIRVTGDSAYVSTTTRYEKVETPVDYVLAYHDGKWWLQDIIVDEVSTTGGYARSFQAVIRKKGFDALMKSLYKRRDKALASH